jgi:hypothetical protein
MLNDIIAYIRRRIVQYPPPKTRAGILDSHNSIEYTTKYRRFHSSLLSSLMASILVSPQTTVLRTLICSAQSCA